MQATVKKQILELRSQGFSYDYIANKLNCSKGTVSYHCGSGQKNKTKLRQIKNRKLKTPLYNKLQVFKTKNNVNNYYQNKRIKNISDILNLKIISFHRKYSGREVIEREKPMFTEKELLKKIGKKPKCYLTGRPIDLLDSRSYQLDHIVPRSKGGKNTLDNCQIACKEANFAKGDLLLIDFFALCKEILEHNKIE